MVVLSETVCCTSCSSPDVIRFGTTDGGNQHYCCHTCGKTFCLNPGTCACTQGRGSALDLVCLNLQVAEEAALPLAYLSGSQKFRIAVSLALAIGQYASRSHARIRSVIIDEGFGSLDPAGQADMVDVLKAVAGSLERVIVVSHLETFADGFQDRFEISLDDKRSRVCRVVGGITENAVAA